MIMASLYKKRTLWSRVLFQDILLDHAGIEVFKAREQAFHLIGDLLTAAFFPAFDVQRHVRVVEGHAQQGPAVREYETHAFIGRLGDGDARLSGPFFKLFKYVSAVGLDVVCAGDFQAEFDAFRRMAQFGNEVAELFAFLLGFRRSDEQFDGQVRAVVEVVVFTQRAVPGCFDGQRRNGAGLVEAPAPIRV